MVKVILKSAGSIQSKLLPEHLTLSEAIGFFEMEKRGAICSANGNDTNPEITDKHLWEVAEDSIVRLTSVETETDSETACGSDNAENAGTVIDEKKYFEVYNKMYEIRRALDAAFKALEELGPGILPF